MIRYNGYVIGKGGFWLKAVDPYNPLNLPPFTIRLKYTDGVTPRFQYGTGVQVSSSPNVWDLTYEVQEWNNILTGQSDLIEVIGANITGVTNMRSMFETCYRLQAVPLFDTSNATRMDRMFYGCKIITSVPLFNTSSCTNMVYMFYDCLSLTSIPLFDTSSVIAVNNMFYNCYNVQSGALAFYQQVSPQITSPINHYKTFTNCGSNTTTGAAELAQIPDDWK